MDDVEKGLTEAASEKLMRLTSIGRKTGRVHTVTIWFALRDGKVYLSHEGEETDWMKNIKKNSRVHFEIGGERFSGRARYLERDTPEAVTAKTSLYEKYYGKAGSEIIDDWFSLSNLLVIEL
jgi:deazaflavin-dependent oxidoreductase (nitroreductase family)